MDLTFCQKCKKVFDQNKRQPKELQCGCVSCTKCLQKLQEAHTINCQIHNKKVNIQEKNLKNFDIKDHFKQQLNKFEHQANLIQLIQDLSGQANIQKAYILSIKKTCVDFQKIFNEIVKQVTWILCQSEIDERKKIVNEIEQVLRKINALNEKYQQIKTQKMVTSQEFNRNINALNEVVKGFESMQNEMNRVKSLSYQDASQNQKSISEISFKVFKEIMSMNPEQRANMQDFSVVIRKCIDLQNQLKQNQAQEVRQPQEEAKKQIQGQQVSQKSQPKVPKKIKAVQIPKQPLQEFKIESTQQLQNIINEFQNRQIDKSSILNNPLNTINLCQKQMILYDLIQLNSAKNQQYMLQILNLAKNQPKIQIAAANSLTLLNYMNFTFANQNYENIDLSNSDLSDTTFTSCNFSNSNLTSANLRNTKFINCDLSNANLTSISSEHPHIFTGHTNSVTSVAISPNSNLIVSGSFDTTLRIYNIATGTCKTMSGHTDSVLSVAISSDSEFIVSGSEDSTVRLWDVKTGTCKTMSGHKGSVSQVAISSDSEFIVSGGYDKTVRLWNVKTGTCKTMRGHTYYVISVAISSDSEFIVSGSDDQTVRLWDVKTGTCKTMSGHTSNVLSVAISSDSSLIISGSADKTIRLWNSRTLSCTKVLSGDTPYIFSVIFSSNNKYILSGSLDQTIRI